MSTLLVLDLSNRLKELQSRLLTVSVLRLGVVHRTFGYENTLTLTFTIWVNFRPQHKKGIKEHVSFETYFRKKLSYLFIIDRNRTYERTVICVHNLEDMELHKANVPLSNKTH